MFDVDGTLLVQSGDNLASLMTAAAEVFGCTERLEMVGEVPHVAGRPVPGWVDGQFADLLARRAGVDFDDVREDLWAAYARQYRRDLADGASPGRVLPGVRALLERLVANGIPVALATGNVAAVAEAKLGAHGLAEFFSFDPSGGFTDGQLSRVDIGRAAVGALGPVEHAYVVGDTIGDMWSAQLNGARGLGVLTGAASAAELRAAGAWAVLPAAASLGNLLFLPA